MTWTPDAATSSVFATLALNFLVGFLALILFEIFRPYALDIFSPNLRRDENEELPKLKSGWFGWLSGVFSFTDEQLLHTIGLDGYVYIRFIKMCFQITFICCLFGLPVLLPIYGIAKGNAMGQQIHGINIYSMANIGQGGDKLWVSLIFAYLFTLVFLYYSYKEYENFARVRVIYFKGNNHQLPPQMQYTILVENIPVEYRTSPRLKAFFDKLFPGEVMHAYVAVKIKPLDKAVEERAALVTLLEEAIASLEAKDRICRPILHLQDGKVTWRGKDKVDAIEFLTDQIGILSEEVFLLQQEALNASNGIGPKYKVPAEQCNNPVQVNKLEDYALDENVERDSIQIASRESISPMRESYTALSVKFEDKLTNFMNVYKEKITQRMVSGSGFVTFSSKRAHAIATQVPTLSSKCPSMKAMPSPAPTNIIWRNMNVPSQYTENAAFLTSLMYYGGLLMWSAVLAFIAAISNLSNLATYLPLINSLNVEQYALLQGILPVIVMILFLQFVPWFMSFVSTYIERRKTKSDIQSQVFRWYFLYQIANVYLLLLTGSAFNSLSSVIDNPASFLKYISAALPGSSIFFLNYIITQLLSGIPLLFLNIGPFIYLLYLRFFVNKKSLTRRQLFQGPLAPITVEYGTALPNCLYILTILLLYWVIAPIVLFAGCFYFGALYIAMKYQYIYCVQRSQESGGQFWYGLHYFSMLALMISSILFIILMVIKEAVKQAPCMLPLPIIIIFAWRYTERKFKDLSQNIPYSAAVNADITAQSNEPHESSASISKQFTKEYLVQPNILSSKFVFPYPHRINKTPIFDESGLVNGVYFEESPKDIDAAEMQKYYMFCTVSADRDSNMEKLQLSA